MTLGLLVGIVAIIVVLFYKRRGLKHEEDFYVMGAWS